MLIHGEKRKDEGRREEIEEEVERMEFLLFKGIFGNIHLFLLKSSLFPFIGNNFIKDNNF